jgi:hypothetical protein
MLQHVAATMFVDWIVPVGSVDIAVEKANNVLLKTNHLPVALFEKMKIGVDFQE